MPLACDPRQTIDVWLLSDDHLPDDQRPTFTYRFLTVAEFFEQRQLFEEREHAEDDKGRDAKVTEALMIGLRSWRNLRKPPEFGKDVGEPIPCGSDPAAFTGAMNYLDKLGLYDRVRHAMTLGGSEKKSSDLPPTSAPGSTAAEPAPSAADAPAPATA
jgi:hypothetical protein